MQELEQEEHEITLKVEGMTCSHCVLSVEKELKDKGCEQVNVNFTIGEVNFVPPSGREEQDLIKALNRIGYNARKKQPQDESAIERSPVEKKFYISLFFTVPLFLHMFVPQTSLLHHPLVQLGLCTPVYIIGLLYFGRSALGSLKAGLPNMDVLIFTGSSAAFIYSIIGLVMFYQTPQVHNYMFFETAATIITLVLLGNVLEHRSVRKTTSAIRDLSRLQPQTAKKIVHLNGEKKIEQISYGTIVPGDRLQVNTGDQIPTDSVVIQGEGEVDESMITGESNPVEKSSSRKVIGGTVLINGNLVVEAEKVGENTVLSKIIELVKKAQQNKPEIQRLGDKVSGYFVPMVILIAVASFGIAFTLFDVPFRKAMMNGIAVLVISCPCAMGLATPTAVMVGFGKAARRGILIKGAKTIEELAKVKTIVFDKTGILTTGKFKVKKVIPIEGSTEQEIINIAYSLELNSSHPVARSLVLEFKEKATVLPLKDLIEKKGVGISGITQSEDTVEIGSFRIAQKLTEDLSHSLYLLKNNRLIGFIDIEDEITPNAAKAVRKLRSQGFETVMLSGDTKEKCQEIALKVGIKKFYSEQLPEQKLQLIGELMEKNPVAMVGDGINDAPALSKATIGISVGNATDVAISAAQVILIGKHDLYKVVDAIQAGKHTLLTIKQNLFWALSYNVIAIPIAAIGLLHPMIAALSMAFSDVVVIGNSLRLRIKKIF